MTTTLSRPPLVVRVAVSGHRDFGDVEGIGKHLQEQVKLVLSTVESSVDKIYEHDANMKDEGLYDHGTPRQLRLVSGLAAGADQMVAEIAARNERWTLEAVLPFTIEKYRDDFKSPDAPTKFGQALGLPWANDLVAFETLLDAAMQAPDGPACIELCGATEPEELRNRSYLAVGQTIVRRCEVLIAIWNGNEAKGKGGTAEVVEFALRNRVPVILIDAGADLKTQWLSDVEDFYRVLQTKSSREIFSPELLNSYLRRLLLIAPNIKPHTGIYDSPYTLKQFREDVDQHCQNEPCKPTFGFGLFRKFRDFIAGHVKHQKPAEDPGSDGLIDWYFLERHKPVDACAFAYSDGYRSTYTLIFLLGALAITAAILGVAGKHWAVLIEFPALFGIFMLFHFEHKRDRHRRWIAGRLFAELLRQSRWLALLGREMNLGRNELKDEERRPEEEWLLYCLQAMIRATPKVHLRLDSKYLSLLRDRICALLLHEQIGYHHLNAERSKKVAKRLSNFAITLFMLTVCIVFFELLLNIQNTSLHDMLNSLLSIKLKNSWDAWLPALAGVIPTLVAATAAFRQQSEFELLEKTSELMHKALQHADQRLKEIDCDQPWAAEQIGEELVRVADLMTADVADWSLVFQVKAVDLT